jgi:hypothetical protein
VAVPQIGQNLHELDWQKCRSFIISSVGGRRLLIQTSLRLAADALSCALPRVPHLGPRPGELTANDGWETVTDFLSLGYHGDAEPVSTVDALDPRMEVRSRK